MQTNTKKNIVIVGAGFGGMTTALCLEKKIKHKEDYSIVLVDKNPYQLYTPALYEIAAIPVERAGDPALKSAVTIPVEKIIRRADIQFMQREVTSIQVPEQSVSFATGETIQFEFLVLALGAETNYFEIPGMKEYGSPLKCFEDALAIRDKIEALLTRKDHLEIIVGGGGATGVEVASELANFICVLQKKIRPRTNLCSVGLTIVEASPHLLPGFDDWAVKHAETKIRTLDIRIETSFPIKEVTPHEVQSKDGRRIPYDILVWTGGVTPSERIKSFSLPLTQKNTFAVNEFLQAEDRIFAIGDNAGVMNPRTGKFLPGLAVVAEREGRLTAINIKRLIEKKAPLPLRPRTSYPYILALGKKYAIANFSFVKFCGILGWCAKIFVELRYLAFVLGIRPALRIWIQHVKLYSTND